MSPRTPGATSPSIPVSVPDLVEFQDEFVRAWHVDPANALRGIEGRALGVARGPSLSQAIAREHLVNVLLWHEEDEVRRPDARDAEVRRIKQTIDALNQERNDVIERIDEELFHALGEPDPGAPLHSETPGAIVDRLSILALKIYHMREEAEREGAGPAHRERCRGRLTVLLEQRADLAGCLEALLTEVAAGRRRIRIYRQFKMYNDPALNPVLRGGAR